MIKIKLGKTLFNYVSGFDFNFNFNFKSFVKPIFLGGLTMSIFDQAPAWAKSTTESTTERRYFNFSESESELKKLFSKPLITGASVSANYGTSSPGRRAALRYTQTSDILTIAEGGRPGMTIIPQIEDQILKDRSLIIALDLFFWDSTLPSAQASLKNLESILQKSTSLGIPIILGDIPALLPGHQPQRIFLNEKIRKSCLEISTCVLFELDQLHRKVITNGHLQIRGQNYTLRQLVPDGLHLAEVASEHLADELIKKVDETL